MIDNIEQLHEIATRETKFPSLTVCSCNRNKIGNNEQPSKQIKSEVVDTGVFLLDTLRKENLQQQERSEELVRVMTHVCPEKITGLRTSMDREGHASNSRSTGDSPPSNSIPKSIPASDPRNCGCHSASWVRNSSPERVPPPGGSCRCRGESFELKRSLNDTKNSCRCKSTLDAPRCARCSERRKRLGSRGPEVSGGGIGTGVPSGGPCLRQFGGGTFSSVMMMLILLVATLAGVSECCSSRSTPKPRHSPTDRPNVTFQTYACPHAYAAWFCLNGATCFTVKIQEAILYNCECAEGYMGPRCEFKDLDGTYLPGNERILLDAGVSSGACLAAILIFSLLGFLQLIRVVAKNKRLSGENSADVQSDEDKTISERDDTFYSVSLVASSSVDGTSSAGNKTSADVNSSSKTRGYSTDESYCVVDLSGEDPPSAAQSTSCVFDQSFGFCHFAQVAECRRPQEDSPSSVISQSSFSSIVSSKLSSKSTALGEMSKISGESCISSNKFNSESRYIKCGDGRECSGSRNPHVFDV